MREVKAPGDMNSEARIFLAGSIEMGAAEKWQDRAVRLFADCDNVLILNPRRDDWDSSWEQSRDNEEFVEQVQWELTNLLHADIILMYFDPNTKAPITLLEMGLHLDSGKLFVVCPDGFYRQGNVDVTCDWYDVPVFRTLEVAVENIKAALLDLK